MNFNEKILKTQKGEINIEICSLGINPGTTDSKVAGLIWEKYSKMIFDIVSSMKRKHSLKYNR